MLNKRLVERSFGGNFAVRRWFWPYALLAVILVISGLAGATMWVSGSGLDRTSAQIQVSAAMLAEPVQIFAVAILDAIAPFSVPLWLRELYGQLVVVALFGLLLAIVLGLLLLPIFYALYRSSDGEEA